MGVSWNYFDKFDNITDKYLPNMGEGNTKATQIVTAVTKLVYKYYNDGDIFDNTYYLDGWGNDLSSYANWLDKFTEESSEILHKINNCLYEDDYEYLLKHLADTLLDEHYLSEQDKIKKVGSIYDCKGSFKFEYTCDDDEYYY